MLHKFWNHVLNIDEAYIWWQLTIVIQETLRLYPPAAFVIREALENITFKDIMISKGINVQIPIPILQRHCDLWGSDAHKFNPERFAHGIVGACKTPRAYLPFGVGSRVCAGQHFAMTELKVILSLILSKFCFSLSPAYRHSPAFRLVIVPEHGVTLCVRKAWHLLALRKMSGRQLFTVFLLVPL